MFDGKLYLSCDICKDEQVPKQLKLPSSPSQPTQLRKGLESRLCSPLLSHVSILSLAPELPTESRLFGLVKRRFIQCLWQGHKSGTKHEHLWHTFVSECEEESTLTGDTCRERTRGHNTTTRYQKKSQNDGDYNGSFVSHPWHSTALLYKSYSSDSLVLPFHA